MKTLLNKKILVLKISLFSTILLLVVGCKEKDCDNNLNLPALLISKDGSKITTPEQWKNKRRPELLSLFEEHVYGKTPALPDSINQVVKKIDSNFLSGKATMQQITLTAYKGKKSIDMNLLLVTPNNNKPNPCFVGLNFWGNQAVHSDTTIAISNNWKLAYDVKGIVNNRATEESRGVNKRRWPFEMIIDKGYAVLTCHSGDIDLDKDDFTDGVHPLFYKEGQTKPKINEWGTIGAWAWGLSRMMDYIETNSLLDEKRTIVIGHSRLGKTSLWTGAQDERFSAIIANNSGCGGAALFRRGVGEDIEWTNTLFPHWYADKFLEYNLKEDDLPIDQHELIALIAPRPVYIASASYDFTADPEGEFLGILHASPVYQLLTKKTFGAEKMPPYNKPINGIMNYHVRKGKHDILSYDWEQYLKFADKHIK